jgi:hypothetical protein
MGRFSSTFPPKADGTITEAQRVAPLIEEQFDEPIW